MLEGEGWDGLALTDSQNLAPDVFAHLTLAAQATTKLKLATGATNAATRHPAVVASAISTVQDESGGRAVLGIARGDSALAYLGRKPVSPADFERQLSQVQGYLRGEAVDLEGHPSRLEWIASRGRPKVPVSVAATGPKVISMAARLAERVTFSVGAQRERLEWALGTARGAAAGGSIRLGAYVNAVAHPSFERARELVRGRLSVYARFASMHENSLGTLQPDDREVVQRLASGYDMAGHGTAAARHSAALDPEFIDRFGVAGPSDYVAERLRELAALGLDHLVIVGHGRDTDFDTLAESIRRFGREVIPKLR